MLRTVGVAMVGKTVMQLLNQIELGRMVRWRSVVASKGMAKVRSIGWLVSAVLSAASS